jgi:hypothetical protein
MEAALASSESARPDNDSVLREARIKGYGRMIVASSADKPFQAI